MQECKYACILNWNIFDPNLTWPKLFQTERTQRLACLPSFCELVLFRKPIYSSIKFPPGKAKTLFSNTHDLVFTNSTRDWITLTFLKTRVHLSSSLGTKNSKRFITQWSSCAVGCYCPWLWDCNGIFFGALKVAPVNQHAVALQCWH